MEWNLPLCNIPKRASRYTARNNVTTYQGPLGFRDTSNPRCYWATGLALTREQAYQHSASFVPKLAGKIVQWLDLQKDDAVLDIGCGG